MARWLLPGLLMFLYAVQCGWFIRTQSLTYDEPVHIAEGLNAWRYGQFEQYNDHPPWRACGLRSSAQPKWQVDVRNCRDLFTSRALLPDRKHSPGGPCDERSARPLAGMAGLAGSG